MERSTSFAQRTWHDSMFPRFGESVYATVRLGCLVEFCLVGLQLRGARGIGLSWYQGLLNDIGGERRHFCPEFGGFVCCAVQWVWVLLCEECYGVVHWLYSLLRGREGRDELVNSLDQGGACRRLIFHVCQLGECRES